jgi:hypothetical protein
MLNVDWLIFLRIIGENNGLSMRTFEINSQLQNIDLDMRIFEKQYTLSIMTSFGLGASLS